VLWGDGPLGLTLRPDLGEDMPPVVGRITRLDSAAALAKVAIGDMLVSINGIDTARQGYDHVVDLLQKIKRPATLRFRVPRPISTASASSLGMARMPSMSRERSSRHNTRGSTASTSSVSSVGSSSSGLPMAPSRKNEQYTVVWTEGPLGMILRPDDDDVHVPCIRKITGKGAGTGMERAAVGDVLVAVNGQETKSLGFRSTISLLKTIRKPAVLKFKRMHRRVSRRRSSRADDPAANGGHPTSNSISGGMPPPMPISASGSAPKEYGAYDIVWREGDLGLKLKPGDRDVPVLSKLTGKGTASGLQNANVGDELVSVNGVLVEGQAYHDTLRMLKHSVKPAVLRFRPGRDRRASGMSITSISSTRSAPSTNREHTRVRSSHVPIYDTGRTPPTSSSTSSSTLARATSSDMTRTTSTGERRKKKRIPLDLAKELVAASQGVELESAVFAGYPILAIQDGTTEAHMLRVEAKMCITAKKDLARSTSSRVNTLTPKEALLRAEEEARVLQEALERVKNQAKAYETALENQKREQLLKTATQNKSGDVVKKHNILLDELAGAIAGLKRDSYSELDVTVPLQLENEIEMQGLMDDLQSVMNIPVVVPTIKYCAECGASEKDAALDLDDDGQHYCKDCWDNFLSAPAAGTVPAATVEDEVPVSPPAAPAVVPFVAEKKPEPTFSPPQPLMSKTDSATSSLSRLSSVEREQEEKNARVEAEKKLMELKELKRTGSGSTRSMERQSSSMNAADRTRRERRGLEELAQALQEEEERARAEGNLTLAKKLSAQRARTMAEAKAEQQQQRNGGGLGHFSSMRDVLTPSEPEYSRYKNGKNGSSGMSSSYDGPSSALAEAADDEALPPPVSLKRSVTLDSPYTSTPKPLAAATKTAVAAAASEPPPVTRGRANDYDDVNSDEEAEDQVNMMDGEHNVLREVEEKNIALAKQLGQAHNVIERARQSIMLSGDESAEDMSAALGLSEEQISLFKKLTTQADERMSTVDRLHPDVSDSDSEDSDSDRSERSAKNDHGGGGGGGGSDDDFEDEDEDDDGVWI
jgi:hypothetical protein